MGLVLLTTICQPLLQAQPSAKSAPETAVTVALLSDPHLDPFRDPAKAKRLAVAPVNEWADILAE